MSTAFVQENSGPKRLSKIRKKENSNQLHLLLFINRKKIFIQAKKHCH